MSNSMVLVGQLAAKATELNQARIAAMVLEQELTDIGYELTRRELGDDAARYLQGRAVKLLGGRPSGEVSERHVFSALEDAYRAGAFAARGGQAGPAPVTKEETGEDGHGAG